MKERLIGAAVLVALAVWLIPWVLNGPEPAAEVESDTLELPAAQSAAAVRTQTIHLEENRDPPTPAPRVDAPAPPSPPAPSARTVAPEPDPPVPTAPPEPASAVTTVAPDPDPPAPSVAPEALDGPAGPPVTAAEPSPEGGSAWMVQIGSFSQEENARRLTDRVATFGFTARVSTFLAGSGPMYRVRVGPEPTRERAVAVASSLSAHGFVAQVVSQD